MRAEEQVRKGPAMLQWMVCAGATIVSLGAQTISFEPPRSFGLDSPALAGPSCLAAGDFNGDGKLDLVASNTSSDNLALLAGKGDGTLQAPAAILVPSLGTVAQDSPSTRIRRGFPPSLARPEQLVHPDRCLIAADLNKDGRLDLAIVSGDSATILVLFGKGDGSFEQPVVLRAGVRPYFIAAADFNGDGIPDLIVATTLRPATPIFRATDPSGIAVLLSRGDETFEAPKILATAPLVATVAIGDVNRDGNIDLVGTVEDSVLSFWQGNGDGTFQAPVETRFDAHGFAYAVADMNGDGKPDVLATGEGAVLVFPGNGDGTFRPFVRSQAGVYVPAIKVGDLNRDGRLDVVVSYGISDAAVLLGKGDGSFETPIRLATPNGFATEIELELADFSSDGIPDLAFANGDAIGVYVGSGDGRLNQTGSFLTTTRILGFWPGDWNGDGYKDLIAYGQGGAWIFEGDGRGNFLSAGVLDPAVSAVAIADLNSDGKTDLIVPLAPNELAVSLNEGGYHFAQPRRVFRWEPHGPEPYIFRVTVCDLNRDGKPDLVIAYGVGYALSNFSLLLGNGDGTFSEQIGSTASFVIYAVADFNRDGAPDLLVTETRIPVPVQRGPLQILFGRGDGTVGEPVIISGYPPPSACPEPAWPMWTVTECRTCCA